VPVQSALGTNYAVTYATDRIGGFAAQEISDLTRVSQRLPLLSVIALASASNSTLSVAMTWVPLRRSERSVNPRRFNDHRDGSDFLAGAPPDLACQNFRPGLGAEIGGENVAGDALTMQMPQRRPRWDA
jgi:hypothetical protein